MNDKPTIPGPQYTWAEGLGTALALGQRCLAEMRTLALTPGPEGKPGPAGKDGERGQKGEAGRNASDLALLQQYIDERVERTIKAAAITTPDGGRTLRWVLGDTVHEIKTAVVIDAGVWKDGTAYVAGDAVSYGGSLFIAKSATTEKPGKSDEWRLAVKRGNDGKDLRPEDKRQPEPVRFR
jgi:integrin beta 3